MKQETLNTRIIKADLSKVFHALSNPDFIVKWQVPGEMTGKIHFFDFRVGGGYSMSLYYPANEGVGKTESNEDRFTSKFLEIINNKKIVESVTFETNDKDFAGEMLMQIDLEKLETGTSVTFTFKNIPKGIDPKDNEEGTKSSLEKLAKLVE
ncbi:SRPBCC domain-containing protein [Flavobacterium limi]|uniref:Activator of Hsp90 ATPase homologue 1/2-like C-terminal domain-containing protein n=1 Tax=Flavobacterium limi TaxID=2045105 RepID=A0ABQ1UD66_9FLAO|nr:SRPBCC domain-containing protein [Flavobacterium limi]GGF16274.1 hypothetical protein GCM10011518_27090 [Flavobacterium limi]